MQAGETGELIVSWSASPATPATACSSPATGSRRCRASFGNDLSTLPDFPAEIRAPAGTVNGVSSFQVHISDHDITTPGDEPNVLVAMNPAALKADLGRLENGGTLIVNEDAFDERNLEKAGYHVRRPAEALDQPARRRHPRRLPRHQGADDVAHQGGAAPLGVKPRDAERSKNFFALGLVSWMYTRPTEPTLDWIEQRFAKRAGRRANRAAFIAGLQLRRDHRGGRPPLRGAPGQAAAPASTRASPATPRWRGASSPPASSPSCRSRSARYPITPASDILHELSKHKHFGVRTVQAEDEIAAAGMALGAAFAGHLGVTTTSGPGLALKSETISLAVSLELPLLIVDIQRGGPSTGLPTKTEAADLNIALYGRHGEAPLPIVAATARRTASRPRSRRRASRSSTARR